MSFATDRIDTWIYVTGVPRSGSTFLGKVLSLPFTVDYIHEPFNIRCGMPEMTRRYRYIRPSLDTPEMQAFHEAAQRLFTYDFELRKKLSGHDSWMRTLSKRLVGSRGPFYLRLAKLNPFSRAAVIKDPTSPFTAAYLHERFGVKPVILVRHPVSLAASLRRMGWESSLHWLAEQEPLIEDHFRDEPDFLTRTWQSALAEAMAHWRAVYKVLLAQAEANPSWEIVTHEAFSRDPIGVFGGLYDRLGLPWSPYVERRIRAMTQGTPGKATARSGRVQDLQRDSSQIFAHRRSQVPPEERALIFDIVQDVALQLYDEASFGLDEDDVLAANPHEADAARNG